MKEVTQEGPFDGVNPPEDSSQHPNDQEGMLRCEEVPPEELVLLTATAPYGTSGADTGDDSMSDDLLEQGFNLIRQAFAAEGKRAVDEFVANLQSSIGGTKADVAGMKRVTRHPSAEKSVRAPAGSARVLCKRALGEAKHNGMTVMKIRDRANGEYEKMLSTSALRNELSTGERLDPPIYKQLGGVWYLTEFAPGGMRIVS